MILLYPTSFCLQLKGPKEMMLSPPTALPRPTLPDSWPPPFRVRAALRPEALRALQQPVAGVALRKQNRV